MPRISLFYGIAVYMYFRDHAPPHFHAIYAEHDAQIEIATGKIIEGKLPRRVRSLVKQWTELHRAALLADWDLARAEQTLEPIPPLAGGKGLL